MRKIAVVTGSRAEYGLLKPLIKAIKTEQSFELQLFVTGMHLMPVFGNTFKQIEEDGFQIDAKIDDGLNGDDARSISKAIGNTIAGFAEAYYNLKPELVIVLGDRSEIFGAVAAAVIDNIPVAHIHGGETTEGAYDEFIRHAITKMSHLHFASCEVYRKRIIQMGENPATVFNVGAIGIDSIKKLKLLSIDEFEKAINYKLNKINVLITFHPVTLEENTAKHQFQELIDALDRLTEVTLIFTKPNSDKGGASIIKMIDDYVIRNPTKSISFNSLGQLRYLSALQYVDFVIGNSSSGILEVPIFKKPTINIGDRQKGREMTKSIINCKPNRNEILQAIQKALNVQFKIEIQNQSNPYGNGTATNKIMNVLRISHLENTKKSFYDLL